MSPDWKRHEREVSEALGLDMTTASGQVWYDKDDAKSRDNALDSELQLSADMKCTGHNSFSVNEQFMLDHCKRADMSGRVFVLPIRFEHVSDDEYKASDFIVLALNDFIHLVGIDSIKNEKNEIEYKDDVIVKAYQLISETAAKLDTIYDNIDRSTQNQIDTAADISSISDVLTGFLDA